MWVPLLCGGIVAYKLYQSFHSSSDLDVDTRHSNATFVVAHRLEKLFGGKAFVGLRIPDADSGTRQTIDLVLVTKTELMVVAVRNIVGLVEVESDGRWVSTRDDRNHTAEVYPDPVEEVSRKMEILGLYLEQRGLTLPKGYMLGRVVLPNPNCRVTHAIDSLPMVTSYSRWSELKPESSGFSSWIKNTFRGGKVDELQQRLHSTLSTSPMWDRLELKVGKHILGEFVEFKARTEDARVLANIKRSKVSRVIVEYSTTFGGLGWSKIYLACVSRDYRSEGSSSSEWTESTVKHNVKLMFHPMKSEKVHKIKLSDVAALTLSV